MWWLVATSHLSLLVQKHFVDAGVEGGAGEHGGDGVGQVQHRLEHRVHGLQRKRIFRVISLIPGHVEPSSAAICHFAGRRETEANKKTNVNMGAQ